MVSLLDSVIEQFATDGFKREIRIGDKVYVRENLAAIQRLRELYARQASADNGSVIGTVPTIIQRLRP